MIDYLIQSWLNIMVLCVSSRPKFLCFPTFICSSKSIGRGKNNLLSYNLLQRIDDTMFDNSWST
jgi:hypothetical protein